MYPWMEIPHLELRINCMLYVHIELQLGMLAQHVCHVMQGIKAAGRAAKCRSR